MSGNLSKGDGSGVERANVDRMGFKLLNFNGNFLAILYLYVYRELMIPHQTLC